MKSKKYMILVLKIVCHMLIWCSIAYIMVFVFRTQSVPVYRNELIYDASGEQTPYIHPQDVLYQTFQIKEDFLESIALAFDYDEDVKETGTLLIRLLHEDDIVLEQPLPFFACPDKTFIDLALDLQRGGDLTLQVINTSEDPACVFSMLSTSNFYLYNEYTAGYRQNDGAITKSSVLCSFKFKEGYDYYRGLTCAFLVFLSVIILLQLLKKGYAWLQRRSDY